MPRTLKRRSELIERDELDNEDDTSSRSPAPAARRRRRHSSSSPPSSDDQVSISIDAESRTQIRTQSSNNNTTTKEILVKKLVRLALSGEYARLPLRRTDILQKILKENNATGHGTFKEVFEGAQRVLRRTFGMELVELPAREKTTLKERRAQATQKSQSAAAAAASSSSGSKAWMLVSTLPDVYKRNPVICTPVRASTKEAEASYTALYTFVLSLIYLNNSVLTDAKLERYLKRMNADVWTHVGATEKLLQRMIKEGYVEKRRDTSGGEESIEWVAGPRGKVEIGVQGVASLVKGVYGFGPTFSGVERDDEEGVNVGETDQVKIEEDELDKRLERSLGIKMGNGSQRGDQGATQPTSEDAQPTQESRRTGRRRRRDDDDDDASD